MIRPLPVSLVSGQAICRTSLVFVSPVFVPVWYRCTPRCGLASMYHGGCVKHAILQSALPRPFCCDLACCVRVRSHLRGAGPRWSRTPVFWGMRQWVLQTGKAMKRPARMGELWLLWYWQYLSQSFLFCNKDEGWEAGDGNGPCRVHQPSSNGPSLLWVPGDDLENPSVSGRTPLLTLHVMSWE